MNKDTFTLGGKEFSSRFILGSGKYSMELIKAAVENAGAQIITLAVRRTNTKKKENILDFIPDNVTLLPNTSGARDAKEAVRIARMARELGCGDFVKVEIMKDSKYLLPDNVETVKATEMLAKEGFVVLPYMYPDLYTARDLVNAGAAAVMPLASPIGSNKGLATKEFIQILIDEIDLPIIVDAGIGKPSQACEAMEMGASAIMANTAIATAGDVPAMAEAFKLAIEAGRKAYLTGMGRVLARGGSASDPLTGFLRQDEVAEKEKTEKAVSEEKETKETAASEKENKETSEKEEKASEKKKDPKDEKIDELNDKLKRSMAEFENYRKRTDKEKSAMYEIGAKDVIEKILPIVDNFERGLNSIPEDAKGSAFADGMEKIYKQFVKTLDDMGVKPIEAVGKPFDPNFHNAVMHVEDENLGENVVAVELQKGYTYKDSIVRHSMVQVAN